MPGWAELRAAVLARDEGRCFVTGQPLGQVWECHHRQPGGMGGKDGRDVLSNLIALRPEVHNLGGGGGLSVHGHPEWSRPLGYLLSPGDLHPPASRPVLHWSLGWVFLDDQGGITPVT